MKVEIGELRQRLTFQEPCKIDDGYGGKTISKWDDVFTIWGKVEPLSGREYFYAHQIQNEVSHRVTIRYRTGINEIMRIKHNGRYLKIESIIDIEERRRFIQLFCKEEK